MAVIEVLRQKQQACSLAELMQDLGTNFSERTVRRWLSLFAQEGVVEISGIKKATRYRAIQQFHPIGSRKIC